MTEQEITKKCVEAFPGIDSTQDRGFSIQDLLSSKSNADALAKQNELAGDLGFPKSDHIISKALLAKTCMDKINAVDDSMPVNKVVERFENKVAEAMLNGSGPEVQLLQLGQGKVDWEWRGRRLVPEQPAMTERQKEIYDAIRRSPKIGAFVQADANARFWIMGIPK